MGAGERLHLQAWLPAGPDLEHGPEPVAVIALVHGYGDHGGRHAWFGEDMAARGYAVYAYDLRGHGQSTGTRGQIKRFDDYLDDTAIFLDEVRRRQPGKPLVLLGHSLGGRSAPASRRSAPRRAGARPLLTLLRADRPAGADQGGRGEGRLGRLARPRTSATRWSRPPSRMTRRWWTPT